MIIDDFKVKNLSILCRPTQYNDYATNHAAHDINKRRFNILWIILRIEMPIIVKEKKKEAMAEHPFGIRGEDSSPSFPFITPGEPDKSGIDVDDLISRIDKKIADIKKDIAEKEAQAMAF